jgi:hypothetical protein
VPLQLTAGDRKILLIAAGVFLFLTITTALLVGGGDSQEQTPTTYSAASGGAKAAYLLLKESGYSTTTWEQPLRDLQGGKGKTLVLADPNIGAAKEDREKLEAFLRSGGRLIASGAFTSYCLPENDAVPDPVAGISQKRLRALLPSPLTRAAPEITLAPQAYWRPGTGVVALYGDPDKPAVIKYKIGDGEVLWLAASTPLTNAGLKEPGNLEFLLAAVGDPGQGEILWDEYVHGYQHKTAASVSSHITRWIWLQLAVFALAILLAYSRRSGPIWIPASDTRLSPLEFVRTLGSLYQHARAGGVAVDISYQRFRYLLTRRLGLSVNAPVPDLERAVSERWAFHEPGFANTLHECESCRYDPNVPAATALGLVQKLYDYAQKLKLVGKPREEKNAWKRL